MFKERHYYTHRGREKKRERERERIEKLFKMYSYYTVAAVTSMSISRVCDVDVRDADEIHSVKRDAIRSIESL